jgi:regulator of protease activity HflC (stomatin/prohibitin superfamily)
MENLISGGLVLLGCLAGGLIMVLVVGVVFAVRVVPPHQRLRVYRGSELVGEKGPGLVVVIPFLDRAEVIDAPPRR